MRRAMLLFTLLASVPTIGLAQITGSVTLYDNFTSKILNRKPRIWVYYPPVKTNKPLPVLYMLDGQNVFDGRTSYAGEWKIDETAEALIKAGLMEPILIVAVANAESKRIEEYTPTKSDRHGGGRAKDYAEFMHKELMPWLNTKYKIAPGAMNTGIAGSSLGGLMTAYMGFNYPKIYGKLGIVSPSVWWDNKFLLTIAKKTNAKIWLDMGTKEGDEALKDARTFNDKLKQLGWKPGKDLAYVEMPGAEHNEPSWANRAGEMLTWLFPPKG